MSSRWLRGPRLDMPHPGRSRRTYADCARPRGPRLDMSSRWLRGPRLDLPTLAATDGHTPIVPIRRFAEQADRIQATAGATGTATWTFTAKAVAAWRTALNPAS